MEDATSAVDWRKWAFVVASISLIWNLANSIFTYWVNGQTKRRSIGLDEFRATVRDPVRDAVEELPPIIRKLREATRDAGDVNALRAAIIPINKEVIALLGQISDTLSDANSSAFADGKDWLDGFDDFQDEILAFFDAASNSSRANDEVQHAIAMIPLRLRALRSSVLMKLDRQVERLS